MLSSAIFTTMQPRLQNSPSCFFPYKLSCNTRIHMWINALFPIWQSLKIQSMFFVLSGIVIATRKILENYFVRKITVNISELNICFSSWNNGYRSKSFRTRLATFCAVLIARHVKIQNQ